MPLKGTNRSFVPPSGVMKPYPFSLLNHFTVPVAMLLPPFTANYHRPKRLLRCLRRVSQIVRKHCDQVRRVPGFDEKSPAHRGGAEICVDNPESEANENENLCGRPCPYMPSC